MAPSKRGTASRGITLLYILKSTKGIHELAGRMQILTKVLDALKSAPPEEWHVEVAYKTVRGPRTGTGREAEQQQEAGVTGESLYVVKSSAAPGRVFMLAAKAKGSSGASKGGGGGGGAGGGAAAEKEFSPLVEMGALGDEVVGILKGYSNRLVLQIEGTSYRVSGGLLHAAAGFLNRGNALSSIVLQVRYENEHASLADAQQVLGEFVEMCLTGQEEEEEEGEEEEKEEGREDKEGREGGREDEKEEDAEVAAVPAGSSAPINKGGRGNVKVERPSQGGGKGREGGREGGRVPALSVKSVDPRMVVVPGFVKEDMYTMKFAALQYIELFKVA